MHFCVCVGVSLSACQCVCVSVRRIRLGFPTAAGEEGAALSARLHTLMLSKCRAKLCMCPACVSVSSSRSPGKAEKHHDLRQDLCANSFSECLKRVPPDTATVIMLKVKRL